MAKGSVATYGGWEPRVCDWCGDKIVLSRQSVGFLFDHRTGRAHAWHAACASGPKPQQT